MEERNALTELSDKSDPKFLKAAKKCFQSKVSGSMKKTKSGRVTVPPHQWFSQFTELAAKERKDLLRRFSCQSGFCEICKKTVCRMYLHYLERHSQFKAVIQCLEPSCSKLINHRKGDLFRHMKVIHGWNSKKSADAFQKRGRRFSIPRHIWVEYKNGNVFAFAELGKSSHEHIAPIGKDSALCRGDVGTADICSSDQSASEQTEDSQYEEAEYTELKSVEVFETIASSEMVAGPTGKCRSAEGQFDEQSLVSHELQVSDACTSNSLTTWSKNHDVVPNDNVMSSLYVSEEVKLQAHCEFIRKLLLSCREFDWSNATGPELLRLIMTLELDLHQMKTIAHLWMEKIESAQCSLLFAQSLLSMKFPDFAKGD